MIDRENFVTLHLNKSLLPRDTEYYGLQPLYVKFLTFFANEKNSIPMLSVSVLGDRDACAEALKRGLLPRRQYDILATPLDSGNRRRLAVQTHRPRR